MIQDVSPYLPERVRQEIALPNNLVGLCALHFYAQRNYQKSVFQDLNFLMSQSAVSNCIIAVTNILNNYFAYLIRFPTTEAKRNHEKQKFMNIPNRFPGIIGAIDCTRVRIHPPKIDSKNPRILYHQRPNYIFSRSKNFRSKCALFRISA